MILKTQKEPPVKAVLKFKERVSSAFYKTSKKLTFKKSEIDDWLHQGHRKSTEELQREAGEFITRKKMKGGIL